MKSFQGCIEVKWCSSSHFLFWEFQKKPDGSRKEVEEELCKIGIKSTESTNPANFYFEFQKAFYSSRAPPSSFLASIVVLIGRYRNNQFKTEPQSSNL